RRIVAPNPRRGLCPASGSWLVRREDANLAAPRPDGHLPAVRGHGHRGNTVYLFWKPRSRLITRPGPPDSDFSASTGHEDRAAGVQADPPAAPGGREPDDLLPAPPGHGAGPFGPGKCGFPGRRVLDDRRRGDSFGVPNASAEAVADARRRVNKRMVFFEK